MMRTLFREMRQGKTLTRALQNQALSGLALHGEVLDVAAKRNASYRRFLDQRAVRSWTTADYDASYGPDLKFDASGAWPVEDARYDCVLLVNCIYIFERPEAVLAEAARVLRPGGLLLVTFPMIWNEVPEPSDFYRFTSQEARAMAARSGLRVDAPIAVGGRFASAVELLSPYLSRLRMYLPAALAAAFLDRRTARMRAEKRHPAPCGYVVVGRK